MFSRNQACIVIAVFLNSFATGFFWLPVYVHIGATARQNQQNDCAQQRLRSAWASAQSDQSLRCPHEEALDP